MSNHHIIEQIIASADIVKIIGQHVELKRSGGEYKGCCPFHGEKTPSFFVNPQKGLYNCFGCGVKGNALTFLKDYENMTAGEALKTLSRQTGIELPKENVNKAYTYQRSRPNTPSPANSQHPVTTSNAPVTQTQSHPVTARHESAVLSQSLAVATMGGVQPTHNVDLAPVEVGRTNHDHPFDHNTMSAVDVAFAESDNGMAYAPIAAWLAPDNNIAYHSDVLADYGLYDPAPFLPEHQQPFSHDLVQQADGSVSLYDLLTQIALFYQQQLTDHIAAQQYLYQRGLSTETIQEFGLGYAPSGWQHLEQAFPQDIEGLKLLGLVRTSQKGNAFDLLRNRIIFPIRDHQGRVVGFAGRALSDDEQPKYINSSDSPVFHKQQILYGLYEGRKARAKDWLVVEGYMDVISLHQAGVYGAVAAMGTALATTQIEKLLQLNPILTLSFDGDSAGQKAAWRAMEVGLPALNDGKELRFLTLPDNHDPDSFVKAYGRQAIEQQIACAAPLSQYVFSILSRRYDITIPEGRGKLLAEVNELTRKLPKGSYGWLLRDDMRSRMGLGKRAQARSAQDVLLNFNSQVNAQFLLQLCFLYQPMLLGAKIDNALNHQLISDIFEKTSANQIELFTLKNCSELSELEQQTHKQQLKQKTEAHLANYPLTAITWDNLADSHLHNLVSWIQQLTPSLQIFETQLSFDDEFELINAKAHFILASFNTPIKNELIIRWSRFFAELSQRYVTDISDLVTEMMVGEINNSLKKQMLAASHVVNKQYYKKQMQTIHQWYQNWLQQKDD